jgi:hypothetical protein
MYGTSPLKGPRSPSAVCPAQMLLEYITAANARQFLCWTVRQNEYAGLRPAYSILMPHWAVPSVVTHLPDARVGTLYHYGHGTGMHTHQHDPGPDTGQYMTQMQHA